MSSDPFDLLGLDRKTATDADVRRAYAERLKVTRPEDDRAGFMALRQAFERARQDVRWRDEYGADDAYEDYEEDEDETPPPPLPETAPPVVEAAPEEPAAQAEDPHEVYELEQSEPEEFEEPKPDPRDRVINAAMERLIGVLTASGQPAAVRDVTAIIDHADLGGIEDYQAMQWQVREFLCDRTGHYLEPPEMRQPTWLSAEIFETLDGYYGWTRQPGGQSWVRRKNDWLVRLRSQIADQWITGEAGKARRPQPAEKVKDNSGIWAWIGGGIILVQVIQFFLRMAGS